MPDSKDIIDIALKNGATLGGIADTEQLIKSPSHLIFGKIGSYSGMDAFINNQSLPDNRLSEGKGLFEWPDKAKSTLVIAYSHPKNEPELDWWKNGGTKGNDILIDIIRNTAEEIEGKFNIKTRKLHYYVEKGGVFLKDAAVLAGLGVIGKSNLFVSKEYGPRVRLRALFLEAELASTGPIDFNPCGECEEFCRRACPENAMGSKSGIFDSVVFSGLLPGLDGFFDREICGIRMRKDDDEGSYGDSSVVKYCRRCEFACPAGI